MALKFAAGFADPFGTGMCGVRAPMTLTWARNGAFTSEVALDIESDEASLLVRALRDGYPRLKLWVDTGNDPKPLVANAPWAPMKATGPDDKDLANTLSAAFASPQRLLDRRATDGVRTFAATDQGLIMWTLVNETNVNEGSTGIRIGTIEPTVARDRTYEDKQIGSALTEMSQVDGGPDFEIEPVDEGTVCGAFNVMGRQGNDLSTGENAVIFEYGPGTIGNVSHYDGETRDVVNKARVIGANGLRGTATDAASIAVYGTHMNPPEQMLDVSEQSTLDAKARALLQPAPVQVVAFDPDPVLAPQPIIDYWLGDTVRFRARHGCINVDLAVRVNVIQLAVDQEGNVSKVTLTIDQAVA